MQPWTEYLNMFITLLAIVDPLGAIPVFIGLTASQALRAQRLTAWAAGLSVALVLVGSAWLGERVLQVFGITIGSFRVAGGLLLLLVGIGMMNAQGGLAGRRREPEEALEGVAVVPLAIPLLSGPGAISTMIIYAHRHAEWRHLLILTGVGLVVALVTGLTLSLAQPLARLLGRTGMNIIVRLMGLILSAAAVQIIANGLQQLFPLLQGG